MKLADYKRADELLKSIDDVQENIHLLEERVNRLQYGMPFDMHTRHYEEIHAWLDAEKVLLQAQFDAL